MARRSLPERLAQLEAQTLALKARLEKQSRAEDTRRRILLGGLVQQALDTDAPIAPALRIWLQDVLPAAVTRRTDRDLFGDLLPDQQATPDGTEGAPVGART
ncbi:MAG: mobilization protein [Pseudomonadota bacterium]